MLTIYGPPQRKFCDAVSRRQFLQAGGLALGGLALPLILRAEAAAGRRLSHKAVLMVYLPGGAPHQDTIDLKPEAPAEIRGPFKPIRTNVPGIDICELLPRLAAVADKLVFLRSLVGAINFHGPDQCLSGYIPQRTHPSIGAVVSKLQGPVDRAVPPFVGLWPKTTVQEFYANAGDPGFLGLAHAPFRPEGPDLDNMRLKGLTADRLDDRKALLASFDSMRRDLDTSGRLEGMDAFTRQALDILTSSKVLQALDLSREDRRVRELYGHGSPENVSYGAPMYNEQLLMARRLIEAGVRCVTVAFGWWDFHKKNFELCRRYLPQLDQALAALVRDLHERGLERDVCVVVWSEFGRSPRVNKDAGREHWPQVSCALMTGGGMRTGRVIGSTSRLGEEVKDRPVHFQNVLATLYHKLGINPATTTVQDHTGRSVHLLDEREPIRELI